MGGTADWHAGLIMRPAHVAPWPTMAKDSLEPGDQTHLSVESLVARRQRRRGLDRRVPFYIDPDCRPAVGAMPNSRWQAAAVDARRARLVRSGGSW